MRLGCDVYLEVPASLAGGGTGATGRENNSPLQSALGLSSSGYAKVKSTSSRTKAASTTRASVPSCSIRIDRVTSPTDGVSLQFIVLGKSADGADLCFLRCSAQDIVVCDSRSVSTGRLFFMFKGKLSGVIFAAYGVATTLLQAFVRFLRQILTRSNFSTETIRPSRPISAAQTMSAQHALNLLSPANSSSPLTVSQNMVSSAVVEGEHDLHTYSSLGTDMLAQALTKGKDAFHQFQSARSALDLQMNESQSGAVVQTTSVVDTNSDALSLSALGSEAPNNIPAASTLEEAIAAADKQIPDTVEDDQPNNNEQITEYFESELGRLLMDLEDAAKQRRQQDDQIQKLKRENAYLSSQVQLEAGRAAQSSREAATLRQSYSTMRGEMALSQASSVQGGLPTTDQVRKLMRDLHDERDRLSALLLNKWCFRISILAFRRWADLKRAQKQHESRMEWVMNQWRHKSSAAAFRTWKQKVQESGSFKSTLQRLNLHGRKDLKALLFREWRRQALDSARNSATSRIEEMNNRMSKLKDELQAALREAVLSGQREGQAVTREKEMERQLEKQIDEFKQSQKTLQSNLAQAEESNDELRSETRVLRDSLLQTEKQVQDLKSELQACTISSHDAEDSLRGRLEASEAANEKLKQQMQTERDMLDDLEDQKIATESELSKAKITIKELQGQLANVENEKESLSVRLASTASELEHVSKLREQAINVRASAEEEMSKALALQEELANSREDYSNKVDSAVSRANFAEASKESLEVELSQLKQEYVRCWAMIDRLTARFMQKNIKHAVFNAMQRSAVWSHAEAIDKQVSQVQAEVDALRNDVEVRQGIVEDVSAERDVAREEAQAAMEEAVNARSETEELRHRVESLTKKIRDMQFAHVNGLKQSADAIRAIRDRAV